MINFKLIDAIFYILSRVNFNLCRHFDMNYVLSFNNGLPNCLVLQNVIK